MIKVGTVAAVHGIKGSLLVNPSTDFLERFAPGSTVLLGKDAYTIKASRIHKSHVLLDLTEVTTRNQAEELIGKVITAEELPIDLPEDEFLVKDLLGMMVEDSKTGKIGQVSEVMRLPGQDVLCVGSILIPFRQEFIKGIDSQQNVIHVELIDGMLEVNQ